MTELPKLGQRASRDPVAKIDVKRSSHGWTVLVRFGARPRHSFTSASLYTAMTQASDAVANHHAETS